MSALPSPSRSLRPLPVRGLLRLRGRGDTWYKPAFSAAAALALPGAVMLAVGRLDLMLYISAGSLCALYAHGQPYAARARTLGWVAAGMGASVAAALCTAAATDATWARVAVAALIAAVHKAVCDATRIGPPANVIFTFIAASCAFLPQRAADVPAHLALVLAGAAVAWLVGMAPALRRPDGPERIAVARALEAVARHRADPAPAHRHAAAGAINAAWHTLFQVPGSAPGRALLERLVVRAEAAMAGAPGDARRLVRWAGELRAGARPDVPGPSPEEARELAGIAADRRAPHGPRGVRGLLAALGPGSPLPPVAARVALGSAVAGWASMLLGVGRPYWAVVTAASVFQANITLSWGRAVQRVVGNLAGLVLFAALLPVTRTGAVALLLVVLAFQIGAEYGMSRNYWLGSVFVTPMALTMVEFAGYQDPGPLISERALDSLLGAAAGLLCCALVPNRRAGGRVGAALERLTAATRAAGPAASGTRREIAAARDRVATALVDLRDTVEVASGEWWQGALPEERIERAERDGHRVLAGLRPAPARHDPTTVPEEGRP
ncbi:FUSC family protein [Actinomadura parmotrematis]|uniref:FUSC family protein n=1 Tax=Actinomadura parmotrematis TaxID=2864039 RepID=A0ABS7FR16_9ACTN|nr:FUSC family protein [Actinomadura parmotrematis]MBW8482854.1 FUSC family protein [Actinomadura parmotrematis]